MKVKCISVRNQLAYWLCAGIKDVENRSKKIESGWYAIHASGNSDDFIEPPEGAFELYDDILKIEETGKSDYFLIEDKKLTLKSEFDNDQRIQNQRKEMKREGLLLSKNENPYDTHCIIGMVYIEECTSKIPESKWALPGNVYWIISKYYYFDNPIKNVAGKLGIWYYDIPDELLKEF